ETSASGLPTCPAFKGPRVNFACILDMSATSSQLIGTAVIFDMDDADKVVRVGDYVISIGKSLKRYDAVDTGMFLCTPAVFDALEAVIKDGNCSLSDGMQDMASNRKLRAYDIEDAIWQDIDTPEMLDFAQVQLSPHYSPLP